jgi:ClpA/ClpB-like protein
MPKATTVRFTDEIFARLDQASARTGMPVNSIVIAACLEWMQRHTPAGAADPGADIELTGPGPRAVTVPPRWATLRRAVELAVGKRTAAGMYPFERFTPSAQKLLTLAQTEALKAGFSYIGTEHMLLAAYGDADFQSAKILAALSVDEGAVRSVLDKVLGRKKRAVPTKIIPTSRVKKVIETSFQLCGSMGDPRVSTGHMLLALATEGEGIAAHVLKDLGATRQRIESQLAQLSEPEA